MVGDKCQKTVKMWGVPTQIYEYANKQAHHIKKSCQDPAMIMHTLKPEQA